MSKADAPPPTDLEIEELARAYAEADNECDSCRESLIQFAHQVLALKTAPPTDRLRELLTEARQLKSFVYDLVDEGGEERRGPYSAEAKWDNVKRRSELLCQHIEAVLVRETGTIEHFIASQKSMPPEFNTVIDEHFDELLLRETGAAQPAEIAVCKACGTEVQWHEASCYYICAKCGRRDGSAKLILKSVDSGAAPHAEKEPT